LQKFLRAKLSQKDLNSLYDIYLKILDQTKVDIPEDLQKYWIDNHDRLGLIGKYLPDDSNLKKYKTESFDFVDYYFIRKT
jgi:hypothetical protein